MTAVVSAVLLLSVLALVAMLYNYARSDIEIQAEEMVSGMSLEEKVGQLFMTDFAGYSSTEAAFRLRQYHNGGFILFEDNIRDKEQLKSLISILRNSSRGLPLMIAIDHEGGDINRITKIIGESKSSRNLVISGTPGEAFEKGQKDAGILKRLGININFAPVLDVRTNEKDKLLLERSFGDDPELVASYGVKYMQGLEAGGIASVVKHFPGHGSVDVDSHFALPYIKKTAAELDEVDLKPFRAAIKDGAGAVMVGHLVVEAYDKERPASLSPAVIDGLLRGGLGFKGVVFTDALDMGALRKAGSPGQIAVEALKAGNDVLLARWTATQQADAFRSVLKAIEDGELSESRIEESTRRVVAYKLKYLKEE